MKPQQTSIFNLRLTQLENEMKFLRVRHTGNDKSYMEDIFKFVCEDDKVVVCTRIRSHNLSISEDYHIFHKEKWHITYDIGCCIQNIITKTECCDKGFFTRKCCCQS